MIIRLEHIAKKFGKHWIFKQLDYTFSFPNSYAILGNNGSGKSTLLKILSGQVTPNKGKIDYSFGNINDNTNKISYCAPYIDIPEELTFKELIQFVNHFKKFDKDFNQDDLAARFGFIDNKWIKDYSSGMKQRVKLILALYADVAIVLLDEPTSNLDEDGVSWFTHIFNIKKANKMIIVASNDEREYNQCDYQLKITDYK